MSAIGRFRAVRGAVEAVRVAEEGTELAEATARLSAASKDAGLGEEAVERIVRKAMRTARSRGSRGYLLGRPMRKILPRNLASAHTGVTQTDIPSIRVYGKEFRGEASPSSDRCRSNCAG